MAIQANARNMQRTQAINGDTATLFGIQISIECIDIYHYPRDLHNLCTNFSMKNLWKWVKAIYKSDRRWLFS